MYCNVLTLKGERKIDRKTKSTQNKTHSREDFSSFPSLKGIRAKTTRKSKKNQEGNQEENHEENRKVREDQLITFKGMNQRVFYPDLVLHCFGSSHFLSLENRGKSCHQHDLIMKIRGYREDTQSHQRMQRKETLTIDLHDLLCSKTLIRRTLCGDFT